MSSLISVGQVIHYGKERKTTMNIKDKKPVSYRLMITLALIVGVVGIALQFFPDFELLSFTLTVAVLGSLIGGSNIYEERDRQRFGHSFGKAFEWLFLVVLVAYALIVLSKWVVSIEGVAIFLNGHWSGLILSTMCIVMGIAGFQEVRTPGSV